MELGRHYVHSLVMMLDSTSSFPSTARTDRHSKLQTLLIIVPMNSVRENVQQLIKNVKSGFVY